MSKHTETMENKMVNNNIKGRALEKEGKTEQAIKLYEFNVKNRFEGNHPYDRLAVIYHKLKQYEKECEVLEIAIDVFENDAPDSRPDKITKLNKFRDRLEKTKKLIKQV